MPRNGLGQVGPLSKTLQAAQTFAVINKIFLGVGDEKEVPHWRMLESSVATPSFLPTFTPP